MHLASTGSPTKRERSQKHILKSHLNYVSDLKSYLAISDLWIYGYFLASLGLFLLFLSSSSSSFYFLVLSPVIYWVNYS